MDDNIQKTIFVYDIDSNKNQLDYINNYEAYKAMSPQNFNALKIDINKEYILPMSILQYDGKVKKRDLDDTYNYILNVIFVSFEIRESISIGEDYEDYVFVIPSTFNNDNRYSLYRSIFILNDIIDYVGNEDTYVREQNNILENSLLKKDISTSLKEEDIIKHYSSEYNLNIYIVDINKQFTAPESILRRYCIILKSDNSYFPLIRYDNEVLQKIYGPTDTLIKNIDFQTIKILEPFFEQ